MNLIRYTEDAVKKIRETNPLILCVANFVSANDCANVLLAIGASPIMTENPDEAAEIAVQAQGLAVNLGTLVPRTMETARIAAETAREQGIPAVLDPVGAGLTRLRLQTARELLNSGCFQCVRGNISEHLSLASGEGKSRGADASREDMVAVPNLADRAKLLRDFSAATGCILSASGKIDLIASPEKVFSLGNGHPLMARITGSGCMLSALTACFLATDPKQPFPAAAAAALVMGLCGERAAASLAPGEGTASFRIRLLDEISLFNSVRPGEARFELLDTLLAK